MVPTFDHDKYADPVAQGAPIVLTPWEIAPGNAIKRPGEGGDLLDVEFTVYFPLRINNGVGYVPTETAIKNGDEIHVRGRVCVAMVQVWKSQRNQTRGGVVILARSKTGKAG